MQFILGAIVGAVVMALFAPQRGDVTREELRAATEDLRRRADELSDRAKRVTEDARKQMQEMRARDGGQGGSSA
ncbi:MAG: YtxH domain-containing protein [Chloroflexi bacterium]|nr:MAG: YtxH domain-containing protein [Chloroflexota bacterium]